MTNYNDFCLRVQEIESRIDQACSRVGREPAEVSLLPVTKTHPVEAARMAAQYGFRSVGENRVQELSDKRSECPDLSISWELIGHLQSNKARRAVEFANRVQSVDSEKLAAKLNAAAQDHGRTFPILVQVNAGDDPAKFGVDCQDVERLMESILSMEHLKVDGLMTIAPLDDDSEVARRCFHRLRETRDTLSERMGIALPELSMGMSGDLEVAIEAGSTMIRVGSALFGARE